MIYFNLLMRKNDKPKKQIDNGIVKIGKDFKPDLEFDLITAYITYPLKQTVLVRGCTKALICIDQKILLERAPDCREAPLLSDGEIINL